MVVPKSNRKSTEARKVEAAEHCPNAIIWDLGRAYFAYVGLLERVLVEEQLDHILRPGMGVVLFALYEEDAVSIKTLAQRSQLACSTLTGVLQRMEQAGVVNRKRDASDSRLVRVALTPLGRNLKSKCQKVAKRMTAISEQGIGEQNTGLCSEFLQGLTTAYRQEEQRLSTVTTSNRSASKRPTKAKAP